MAPKQKATLSACRMLGIREHSEKQIREKLTNKGFCETEINEAVTYLYEENWLSNERFCESFIRSKATRGQGRLRVEKELLGNGISKEVVNQYLYTEEVDWQSVCNKVLVKKLDSFSIKEYEPIDLKIKKKIENFLKYRGFDYGEIKIAFSSLPSTNDKY